MKGRPERAPFLWISLKISIALRVVWIRRALQNDTEIKLEQFSLHYRKVGPQPRKRQDQPLMNISYSFTSALWETFAGAGKMIRDSRSSANC